MLGVSFSRSGMIIGGSTQKRKRAIAKRVRASRSRDDRVASDEKRHSGEWRSRHCA
jgi:hypothetical protein